MSAVENGSTTKIELVESVPHFVAEMMKYSSRIPSLENVNNQELIGKVFSEVPLGDADKLGWLRIMTLAYRGHFVQQGQTPDKWEFIGTLQQQLTSDDARFGDTWKHRPVEGQMGRTYDRYGTYLDQFIYGRGENKEFDWLKVAGGAVICLTRIENPDYDK